MHIGTKRIVFQKLCLRKIPSTMQQWGQIGKVIYVYKCAHISVCVCACEAERETERVIDIILSSRKCIHVHKQTHEHTININNDIESYFCTYSRKQQE